MRTNRPHATMTPGRLAGMAALVLVWSTSGLAQVNENGPNPASAIEVGPGSVSNGDPSGLYKAGEYNGLGQTGGYLLANVDRRGGGTYDTDNAVRWRIQGTNLGLETRRLAGEVGQQGRVRALFVYDELRRNRSDSYQTPYLGVGTATLSLPVSWLVPLVPSSSATNNRNTTVSARGLVPSVSHATYIDTQTGSPTIGQRIAPTATQLTPIDAAAAADLPAFATAKLSAKRKTVGAGVAYEAASTVGLKVAFETQQRDGLQPLGTVSRNTGGDISTIIPLLIDSRTNQVSASAAYKGDRSYLQGGYYASLFTNHAPSVAWQNWATGAIGGAPGTVDTISGAPSNTFHQFNATGRYDFTKTLRVMATGSYGRNGQNDSFLPNASTPVVPETSLNGLVVWSSFGAKVTSRPAKSLNMSAGYKFEERDDRTGIHIYQYGDAEEGVVANPNFPAGPNNPLGPVLAQNANANRPYSQKLHRLSGEAEYGFAGRQWLKGGYDFERIDHWCAGTWISCAVAAQTSEHTGRAEWRGDVGERFNAHADYAFSARRTPAYNEDSFLSIVPYANVVPVGATDGVSAYAFQQANGWTAYGPQAGFATTTGNMNLFFPSNNVLANTLYGNANRISELIGMRRFFVSNRDRHRLRSLADWQATESLSVSLAAEYTGDRYPDAVYGLQRGRTTMTSLDVSYLVTDTMTATFFTSAEWLRTNAAGNTYTNNSNAANVNGFTALSGNAGCDTYTTLQQRNNNNKLDPCLEWSSEIQDQISTVGVTVDRRMTKLDLTGTVIRSHARTDNDVTGGNWANNPLALTGAAAGTVAAYYIQATALPVVSTDRTELWLGGKYTVKDRQWLRVTYSYLRMRSGDWMYQGMQTGDGTLSGVLPTNEQPFNYGVHIFGVSYILGF